MIRNYLKITYRNFYRNKLHSAINIAGLSIAIACCIVGYVNYEFSQSFDNFHKNGDQIYGLNCVRIDGNRTDNWTTQPVPMAASMKKDIPGIIAATRYERKSGSLRYKDKIFMERFVFVDTDFYHMFSFRILRGNEAAFETRNGIILSEEIAGKYYGDEDPIGKQMTVSVDNENYFNFVVTAVIQTTPTNTALNYSILLPFERLKELYKVDLTNWEHRIDACLIQIDNNSDPDQIEKQLQYYKNITNAADHNWQVEKYYLDPLKSLAFTEDDLRGDPYQGSLHPAAIIAPSVTALLILLLACFNFMNLSISSSAGRLKEIGIRKTLGAFRRQLTLQFLGENIILCSFALLLGLALGEIFVDFYDDLWPEISLTLNYSKDLKFLSFLFVLLISTAIIAGLYPALYISRYKPVIILRGVQKLGNNNSLIQMLLVCQFALAMINIMFGIVFLQNSEYFKNLDMGFQTEDIIQIPLYKTAQYDILEHEIRRIPGILNLAPTQHIPSLSSIETHAELAEHKSQVRFLRTGKNYFNTLGMRTIKGRDLNMRTDENQALAVNELFCKEHGLKNPIGKYVKLYLNEKPVEFNIVGVIEDFRVVDIDEPAEPTVISMASPEQYSSIAVRVEKAKISVVMKELETRWQQLFPNLPYRGFYFDAIRDGELRISNAIKTVALYISIIAALIVAMGLFALIAHNIEKRSKEIAIRQILGATISSIGKLLIREFTILFIVSGMISAVSGYYLISMLLDSIWKESVGFGLQPVWLSLSAIISIAAITMTVHLSRLRKKNPIENLRYE